MVMTYDHSVLCAVTKSETDFNLCLKSNGKNSPPTKTTPNITFNSAKDTSPGRLDSLELLRSDHRVSITNPMSHNTLARMGARY